MNDILLVSVCFLIIAFAYSAIGHAGASGYLAVMSLLSFTPESMKPTSLVLNILVAGVASARFIRAGYFDRKIFLSFAIASVPMSFVGGSLMLDPYYFRMLAGVFLVASAVWLLVQRFWKPVEQETKSMPLLFGIVGGAAIGLVSGLIGVGGGIFLSPVLILAGWAGIKQTAGISSLFIFCNSVAGLAGNPASLHKVDSMIWIWIIAVLAGGVAGSYLGSKRFGGRTLILFLFAVMFSAGVKLLLERHK